MTPQQLENKLKKLARKLCCLTDLVNTLTTTSTTTTTTAAPSDIRLKTNIKPTGKILIIKRNI